LLLLGTSVGAQTITGARYVDAVERYGHFVLGRPHEYARLIATTDKGTQFALELPVNEVFEDLAPRLVRLAANKDPALFTIVSNRYDRARLALIRLRDQQPEVSAQSEAIGSAMRWLNPIGVADLDGHRQAEIAAVITPHIGGNLKVYRQRGDVLVEIASLAGFSNHVYRSSELALSLPVPIDAQIRLLVPNSTRSNLRIVALIDKILVELGRCALDTPITGALTIIAAHKVSVSSASNAQIITLTDCIR
jgi:hypothetical protein